MIWYDKPINEAFRLLRTSRQGLTQEEYEILIAKHGENKLKENKQTPILKRLLQQLSDFMVVTLIAAAFISFFISMLKEQGDFAEPCIILIIVLINATLGVIQEVKAEKAIQALKKMSAPHAKVRRDGKVITVECEQIVIGDILILNTGDYIPADARIIECTAFKTEESSLTGESQPQEKHCDVIDGNVPIADWKNIIFATTLVVAGHAEAVVTATGMNTEVGKIADMLISTVASQTPLQVKLAKLGKNLGIGTLAICAVIFAISFIKQLPIFDMFMTSVSLAVAAIPEGLPAIVTVVLAIGVIRMSAKNAIIRKLPAVETLGSATIICSDKTGTLTQNKIKVIKTECDKNKNAIALAAICCNGNDPTERAIMEKAGIISEYR
ncbi:MAG: HAD-IC family P-type ATPase, partial [Clostridiaceae bacterium]|nr:HAD-IC family P-type ATPase [Clostridiaceae bacterium]